jgi:LysR family transcriptional regulator for metE and metH
MSAWPLLDLRHLRMLTAIADTGSVSAAAGLLAVTPSALSHRIREAERRLDVTLFGRLKGRLYLTPAGECLYQSARRVLGDLGRAEAEAIEMSRGVEHIVRIGIGFYSAYHWLPGFLRRLAERAPEIRLEVDADAARRPIATLLEGGIDIAIVPGSQESAGVAGRRLFTDELVAIMAPTHHLAGRPYITAEDLADEDYFSYSREAIPGHEYDRLMAPADIYPRRYVLVELPEAIVELVAAGLGISILSRWAVAPHIASGKLAHARVTAEGIRIDWYAGLRAADGDDTPAAALAAMLADWCAESGGFA